MVFKESRFIVACHYPFITHDLALTRYLLLRHSKEVMEINHPLYADEQKSYAVEYQGKSKKDTKFRIRSSLAVLNYFLEPIQTIFFLLKKKGVYDCFIGYDNLNAFTGICLRKIGKVKKVIYYTVDYSPQRFPHFFFKFHLPQSR